MDMINIILGISNIFIGILMIIISIPLVRKSISMNKIYGVRFKKSFESEENWYKINVYGGKQLIIWSFPLILFGVITFFLPLKGNELWILLTACAPLIVLVPAIMSYLYSRKL
jgi:hypothetical protein